MPYHKAVENEVKKATRETKGMWALCVGTDKFIGKTEANALCELASLWNTSVCLRVAVVPQCSTLNTPRLPAGSIEQSWRSGFVPHESCEVAVPNGGGLCIRSF